jgi:hypothetical protein
MPVLSSSNCEDGRLRCQSHWSLRLNFLYRLCGIELDSLVRVKISRYSVLRELDSMAAMLLPLALGERVLSRKMLE